MACLTVVKVLSGLYDSSAPEVYTTIHCIYNIHVSHRHSRITSSKNAAPRLQLLAILIEGISQSRRHTPRAETFSRCLKEKEAAERRGTRCHEEEDFVVTMNGVNQTKAALD